MKFERKLILALAILIFFVLSQWIIFSVDRESWFDVSFSLQTAHTLDTKGFSAISFKQYDVHPGTYYYLLASWQLINPGFSEYHWGEELSVFFGVLFILIAGIGLEIVFGSAGLFAVCMLAMCTTYLHYGTEVRMYSLVLLLSSIVFLSVIKGLKGRWLVIGGLAVFTLPMVHYFASMAVFFYASLYYFLEKRKGGC